MALPVWVWKRLIAAWVCFHLVGAACNPNLSSLTAQRVDRIYMTYMNVLGLGGLWSFFAPEPYSPPMYIDYTVTIDGDFPVNGRFPDDEENLFFQSSINRRAALARFILGEPDHLEYMFMNYLCHRYPNSSSAKLWSVRGIQPDYHMVRELGRPISKSIEFKSDFAGEFVCLRNKKE